MVRELLLGPKRFTDLQQALPAASPNALSDRLRELADAGVVRRRQLPPPVNVQVYELTVWGRGLEPIVIALGAWALAAPPTAEQAFLGADSAMLTIRTFFVPTPQRPDATLRIELRDRGPAGVFGVRLMSTGAEVTHDPPNIRTPYCSPQRTLSSLPSAATTWLASTPPAPPWTAIPRSYAVS